MNLQALLAGVDVVAWPSGDVDIQRLSFHSSLIEPETLFVACRYPWLHDRRAVDAVHAGAAAVMIDEHDECPPDTLSCPVVVVRAINQAYATACANLFGNAHRDLRCYGVTGTKGKTTTCHLLEAILNAGGHRTGVVSTIVQRIGTSETISHQSTPDPYGLHGALARMRAAGATHAVLEVSSIGLAEDRLHGIQFDAVAFTNLGAEHLSYHGGVESYQAAKRRLFADRAFHHPRGSRSIVNADDPFGRELAKVARGTVVTYGIDDGQVRARDVETTADGLRVSIDGIALTSRLIGAYNVPNLAAAVAMARTVVSSEAIADGVSRVDGLPGRFERIAGPARAPEVFVDYAHTPESVRAVLQAAATVAGARRRVVLVGCGGNSDKEKRAPMARAALAQSELCILTSDNPRSEEPEAILGDMTSGLAVDDLRRAGRLEIVVDRRVGIHRAIEAASADGVVMLLGRGSEPTQIIGSLEIPFDDREVAREALNALYGR